jgi:hypothetical protein
MRLTTVNIIETESRRRRDMNLTALSARLAILLAIHFCLFATFGLTQNTLPETPAAKKDNQLNVNWLYGSYIPKEVPLES